MDGNQAAASALRGARRTTGGGEAGRVEAVPSSVVPGTATAMPSASLREAYARGFYYEVKFKDGSVWRPPRPPTDANQVMEAANEFLQLLSTNLQKLEEEKDKEQSPQRKKSRGPECARKEIKEACKRGWDDFRVKVEAVSETVLTQAPLAFAREQSSVAAHEEMANGSSSGCRCCDSRGCLCCSKGNA